MGPEMGPWTGTMGLARGPTGRKNDMFSPKNPKFMSLDSAHLDKPLGPLIFQKILIFKKVNYLKLVTKFIP